MKCEDLRNRVFAINKPVGPTSNQVLNTLRKKMGIRKIGHAGTLDPLAEGVLVVATGTATRQLTPAVDQEKEYLARMTLGMTSRTDDAEGPLTPLLTTRQPSQEEIRVAFATFVGRISQIPPVFSAIKVRGREAYKRVRAGQSLELPPRMVVIKRIDLCSYQWPDLELRIVCGKGVYIRSLARDLGKQLGTGAYLSRLVRTRVGSWTLDNAISLNDL